MKQRVIALVTLPLLLLVHALTGTADGSVVIDRVVAVVNEEIITMSDLEREVREAQQKDAAVNNSMMLEELINRKLQLSAAKRAGLDATDKEVADAIEDIKRRNSWNAKQFEAALAGEGLTVEQYRSELKENITISRIRDKHVRAGLSVEDAEVRRYYELNSGNYALPQEIRVRQIFIRLPENAPAAELRAIEEKANRAAARAKAGENFVALVKELSEGPSARLEGDLGYIQRDHALPEIDGATRGLQSGGIAGPLRTNSGFHIIRLEDVRTPVKPLDQVRDEIANSLYMQKMENNYRVWLQTLRNESHVENRL